MFTLQNYTYILFIFSLVFFWYMDIPTLSHNSFTISVLCISVGENYDRSVFIYVYVHIHVCIVCVYRQIYTYSRHGLVTIKRIFSNFLFLKKTKNATGLFGTQHLQKNLRSRLLHTGDIFCRALTGLFVFVAGFVCCSSITSATVTTSAIIF